MKRVKCSCSDYLIGRGITVVESLSGEYHKAWCDIIVTEKEEIIKRDRVRWKNDKRNR